MSRGAGPKAPTAPVPTTTAGRGARRWLLLYNCQAQGLANCLGLLGEDLQVDAFEVPSVQADAPGVSRLLANYERVLLLPAVRGIAGFDPDGPAQLRDLPSILFSGYHPDLFRLGDGAGLRHGPLGNFHSLLAYGGWRLGRDVAATAALFRDDTFEALGYFDGWVPERDALLARFARAGLDLRAEFVEWSRRGPFMYNPIHPAMPVLRDLARRLLQEAGVPCRATTLLPHDNLVAGAVFPVYPGIAARLGVAGGFEFKPQGRYETWGLAEFVARSFAAFERHRDAAPVADDQPRIDAMLERLAVAAGGSAGA